MQRSPNPVVGFSTRFAHPHYCDVVREWTVGDLYGVEPGLHTARMVKYKMYTPQQAKMQSSVYLFTEEERKGLPALQEDTKRLRIFFRGLREGEENRDMTLEHFAFGTHEMIAAKIESNEWWPNFSRNVERAYNYIDILTSNDKQLEIAQKMYDMQVAAGKTELELARFKAKLVELGCAMLDPEDQPLRSWAKIALQHDAA